MPGESSLHHPFVSEEARDAYLSFYDEKARRRWPPPNTAPSSSLGDNAEECERMIETSFGRTFVRIAGGARNDARPPLVLISGDGETSLAWSLVVESLSQKFRVYALDWINDTVGRSVPNPQGRVAETPGDLVEWLHELMLSEFSSDSASASKEGRGRVRVHLVAHSYGAWLASLYVLSHPETVDRLVLLAPAATVLRPSAGVIVRSILYEYLSSFSRPAVKRHMYWFAPASIQKEQSRAIVDEMIEEQLLSRRCFKSRRFVLPTTLTDEELGKLGAASSSGVPTLFVVGDKEVVYSPEEAIQRLEKVAPSIERVIVAEADHHLALVQPERVQEEILQFLLRSKE